MPIHIPAEVKPVSKDDFDYLDRIVMGCAYASQNHFGNLADERVYENDVAKRLRDRGITDVQTQVPFTITHKSFKKTYFLDLVVGNLVYEFKAESSLSPAHEAQVLNYAALAKLNRIKLLNFGSEKVQGRLLCTPFQQLDRFTWTEDTSRFRALTPSCDRFLNEVRALMDSLGGYLTSTLYRQALVELLGGELSCVRRVDVVRDGVSMGTHSVQLISQSVAFLVPTMSEGLNTYLQHVRQLLSTLPLEAIQVVNVFHSHVQLVSIQNK